MMFVFMQMNIGLLAGFDFYENPILTSVHQISNKFHLRNTWPPLDSNLDEKRNVELG